MNEIKSRVIVLSQVDAARLDLSQRRVCHRRRKMLHKPFQSIKGTVNAMKFQIQAPEGGIDHLVVQRALLALDEGVAIKLDPFSGRLRIEGNISEGQAIKALLDVGYRIDLIAASDCCGSCG